MYKLGIIEDDPVTRAGVVRVLGAYPDIQCLIAASSIDDFWERLPERATLDIVFIDIDLPGESGLDVIPALRKRFADAELIIYTQSDSEQHILRAFSLGATGYLLKEMPYNQLRSQIEIIMDGGAAISSRMARKLIQYFNPPKRTPDAEQELSEKEEQVLQRIAEGNSYEECADMLGISTNGVKYHIKNIYRKLNVNNRMEAVAVWKNNKS